MNPNATPENIAAAQRVVQEQAEAAGRDIENQRITNLSNRQRQTSAALEKVLDVVSEAKRNLAAGGFPVLRAKVVVIDLAENNDPGGKKTSETLTLRAVYDGSEENKSFAQATPSLNLDIHINNPAAFGVLKKGAEVYLDFTPAQTPAPVVVVSSQGAGSGKVGDGDEALKAVANPPFGKPGDNAAARALKAEGCLCVDAGRIVPGCPVHSPEKLTPEKLAELQAKAPAGTKPITGTTGSQGTNDQSAKLNTAGGPPVDPNDPNATGPSTDAGQATKGEMKDGHQTGGTTGAGTGKGESERAAAREAGNSDAAARS